MATTLNPNLLGLMPAAEADESLPPLVFRTLNVKLLGCLLGALLALGVGTHFLHAYQVKRNAKMLLQQAEAAEKEGKTQECIKNLGLYLAYLPEDTDTLEKYGLLLYDQASGVRGKWFAVQHLEQVVRRDPERSKSRRRVAEFFWQNGRYADATPHLEVLLQVEPDGDLEYKAGLCYEELGDFVKA